jgi:mitogen-activated protein kinase kinase kinase 11
MASSIAPLQHVLRFIHCVQKERGASCALARADANANSNMQAHQSLLRTMRVNTNSAISSFYAHRSWYNQHVETDDRLEVATQLYQIRQLVDGKGDMYEESNSATEDVAHYHRVLTEFNSFVASVIQVFVVNTVNKTRDVVKQALRTLTTGPDEAQIRKNYEIALSLLSLILSFVSLKESLGMERATLMGLIAFGKKVVSNDKLPVIVNDLVMVVENHHRIMRDLEQETGVKMDSLGGESTISELAQDANYSCILRLIAESIKPSESMKTLQDHIRKDFDANRLLDIQQEMSMGAFWSDITLYMDKLHSTELILLEELSSDDNYSKTSYQNLDLLSLETRSQQTVLDNSFHNALKKVSLSSSGARQSKDAPLVKTQSEIEDVNNHDITGKVSPSTPSKAKPSLEEWEINLYDVEFQKRIGRGAAGTTYLGKWCGQKVAIKVAAINEMGLDGWSNELKSLTKLHHCNIIHFLGAIFNPSPLTYCLVLEYCDGGDLSASLSRMTPPNFFKIVASGVASGLLYLHKKKILHRDVKPGNVLLSGDLRGNFTAKLTDFGLAAMLQNNASINNGRGGDLTAETGTYRYMAPEVIKHERYQYSADIYSLSMLLWEMITREAPFKKLSQIEAAGSVALEGKRPPFPKGIPSYVKSMIEKCWTEKPDQRMSVEELIKTLDEIELNLTDESKSWLDAPNGHPVYDVLEEEEDFEAKEKKQKPKPKRTSLFKKLSKT